MVMILESGLFVRIRNNLISWLVVVVINSYSFGTWEIISLRNHLVIMMVKSMIWYFQMIRIRLLVLMMPNKYVFMTLETKSWSIKSQVFNHNHYLSIIINQLQSMYWWGFQIYWSMWLWWISGILWCYEFRSSFIIQISIWI